MNYCNGMRIVACKKIGFRLSFYIIFLMLMLSIAAYGNGEHSWLLSYPVPDSDLPLMSTMDVKKNVLIGPFVVRTNMTGTITMTSPTGSVQTLSVRLGENGFSGEMNLSEIGNYRIDESYNLDVELLFANVPIRSSTFNEIHSRTYNNTVSGIKSFNVTSNLSNMGADIDGYLEIYSIEPFSVKPGEEISVMLRALDSVSKDNILATSIVLHGQWDKSSSITTSNFPPTISINVQPQSYINNDVRISFTLGDVEDALCIIQAEYSRESADSWISATLSSTNFRPGSGTLYWRASMDQPNGQGAYNIRMRASDTLAYSSWAAGSVVLNNTTAETNNPPSAINPRIIVIDGTTNQEVDRPPITGDKLKAAYDFFDPDGHTETNSQLTWYKLNVPQQSVSVSGENDPNKVLSLPIKKGETWYFEIVPSDGSASGALRRSGVVTVGNAPPRVTNINIEPFAPGTKDDLQVTYEFLDPENDPEGNTQTRWYRNGISQSMYNNLKVLPSSATERGDKWKVEVQPWDADGGHPDDYTSSSEITIVNQMPEVQITSISGSKDENGFFYGDITVTYNLIDEDDDVCSVSVYYRGGTAGVQKISAHIAEASTDYHTVSGLNPTVGLTLTWQSEVDQPSGRATDYRIGIIPNDGAKNGFDALSNSFSLDNNAAPSAADLAISPSPAFSSDDLTAAYEFLDDDGDEETGSVIRWYQDGIEQTAYRNFAELSSEATSRGEKWHFTVEPRDGKEAGDIKTSPSETIQNAPPTATDVALSPVDAGSDDNLEASYTYNDSDGDAESGTSIRWYRNGSEQIDYEDETVILWENTSKGDEWYFTVQVSDGITPGEMVESNHIVLGNVAPEIRALTVPEQGFRDVPIKFDLVDADGDLCSLTIEYRGGQASTWTPATIREPLTGIASNELVTLTWDSEQDQNVTRPTNFQVRITPNDGTVSGETVISDLFTLDNNEPPVASDLRILPENPVSTDNLTASYQFTDPDGGQESGSEIIWHRDDTKTDNKGKTLLASATKKDQSWHYTVRPRDGAKFGQIKTSAPVLIGNLPPFVRDVMITPANPGAGDTLEVRYDYRDLDSDRESGTFIEWFKNGTLEYEITLSSNEDRSLPVAISKGDRWYAVVTPNDGFDFGEPVPSNTVTAGNSVPEVENISVTGGTGEAIITYDLIDNDGDKCDLVVEYQGGSVVGASWAPATIAESTTGIAPGTNLTLTWISDVDERGQSANNYRIRMTPSDGVSTGESELSPTFSFSNNAPPTASGLLILPPNPKTSDDLEIDYVFIDPDGDSEAKPEVQWYKNGFQEIKYNNLTVLPNSATTRGDRWHYTLRVNDGKEYGKILQSAAVTIENAPPDVENLVLAPDQPSLDDQLVAHYEYVDADGDAEAGTLIQWYRNGFLADFDNFVIIPGVFTQGGDEWYFTVMPKDGSDFGIPRSSDKVYIANDPPIASGLDLQPRRPLTTDDLVASYIYDDPEGDPEDGSQIIWYKGGIKQSAYNDMFILPASATAKKQVWYFTIQPNDGKQFGDVQKSNSVVVENTPPRADNLAVSPPYPLDKDNLMATYEYIDSDGDSEGRSEIKWYRNDIWIPDYTTAQLPARATSDGEIWYFTVMPKDDEEYGEKLTSPPVEIGSPIPRANNLTIVPANPFTTDPLAASYIFFDPRGISESGSQITWFKDGVAQPEYKEKILPADATARGEQWYFSVIPSNGLIIGEEQSSIPVTIVNSAPTLTSVAPKPDNPTTDDVLAVNYNFEDADNDVEIGNEIKWFRDGVLQPGYNNATEIPASATKRNEQWHFTIRSRDDSDFSDLVTSDVATIGNGRPRLTDIELLPSNPLTGDDIQLIYTFNDTEADPESGTEIRWFRNEAYEPEYDDENTIPSEAITRGDVWHCTIRPSDGMDFGELFTSPSAIVGNTPPVAEEILAEPDRVMRGDSIDIVSYGQDDDSVDEGAGLTCQIQVRFGSGAWSELVTEYVELPAPQWKAVFAPDESAQLGEYDFRARFTDGTGANSDWVERENMVTVDNRPPTIAASADNLHVPEDTAREFDLREWGSDLEDGRTLTWSLDEASVERSLFQATINGNRFLVIQPMDNENGQDDITIIVEDTDGSEFEKADVTVIVDPVNDPPGVPSSVSISPGSPKTSDSLTCEAEGSTDPDEGAVIVYRYQWYKDDVLQPTLKSNTVPQSRTSKGELWRCEVTPSDGFSDGASRSVEVTIGNTLPEASIRNITGDTRDILIIYELVDADSDDCDLKVEYWLRGKTWKQATIVESLRGVKPGTSLSLTWRSHIDLENVVTDDCKIKITPDDGPLPGNPGESASFALDNLPPELTITAIVNPIHPRYVDITVIADEELSETPEVSVVPGENSDPIDIEMESIADTSWVGMLMLESGFDGLVKVSVEGVDLVGNTGQAEMEEQFSIALATPRPPDFALEQNYPNPVVEDTYIPYQLPESSNVVIIIYNLKGQLVRTLDEGYKVAGFYLTRDRAAYWDGNDNYGNMVASGLYFYYLKADGFEALGKMGVSR